MLRLSGLARAVSLVPTRQARRRGAMGMLKGKSSTAAAAAGRGEDEDGEDDDDDAYFEEDWDDIDDDDDDADAFELGDDWDGKDEDWQVDGLPFPTSGGGATRKMEEHVKQKVRIQRAKHAKRRFVDRIRIKATGGHGGNGCSSFFSAFALTIPLVH